MDEIKTTVALKLLNGEIVKIRCSSETKEQLSIINALNGSFFSEETNKKYILVDGKEIVLTKENFAYAFITEAGE